MSRKLSERFESIAVPGLSVGHAQDLDALTGVTVMAFDRPAPAAAHLCGKATSTRQADALRVDHFVPEVDAFVFTGGSAFGLDATGGVLRYLEREGRGLPTRYGNVPICPTAALYDLGLSGSSKRPDAEMGEAACRDLSSERMRVGSVGAGCGATVGKLYGRERAMKGGLGTVSVKGGGFAVQAIVACNGFGDVLDAETGRKLAGVRTAPDSLELADTVQTMQQGEIPGGFTKKDAQHTVLCAVFTTVKLTKTQCLEVGVFAEEGLKRSLNPAGAPFDGDVIFVASLGKDAVEVEEVGHRAAEALAQAIRLSVIAADGFGVVPAWRDLERAKPGS